MTYAGRLDPMASGKLLLLIGDECKRRERYDGLDKSYEFEVLFGFTSDTGDILGLADACAARRMPDAAELRDAARRMRGRLTLPYPAFSSKTVDGTALHARAHEGTLPEALPRRDVRVYSLRFVRMHSLSSASLLDDIERRLGLLRIDERSGNPHRGFRRDEALARWRELLKEDREHRIAHFTAVVSSGTYVRSLAPALAEGMGLCGLAYSIRRTAIGRYQPLTRGTGFWLRGY